MNIYNIIIVIIIFFWFDNFEGQNSEQLYKFVPSNANFGHVFNLGQEI